MNAKLLIAALLILVFFLHSCNTFESDESGGNTTTDPIIFISDPIDNASGTYNGNWRLICESEKESFSQQSDEYPQGDQTFSDSDSVLITDTSTLLVIAGDSLKWYEYDDDTPDSFFIEPTTFEEFNSENDTTGLGVDIAGMLDELKEEFGADSGEVKITKLRLVTDADLSNDTLTLSTEHLLIVDFTVYGSLLTFTVTISEYESEKLVFCKYTGTIPPSHWPEEFGWDTCEGAKPELYVSGPSTISVIQHTPFTLPTASAHDMEEGSISERITISLYLADKTTETDSATISSVLGEYYIRYYVEDSDGNSSEKWILVVVTTLDLDPLALTGIYISDSIFNFDGTYDGAWIMIYEQDAEVEVFQFDQNPALNMSDSGTYIEYFTDTTKVKLFKRDTVTTYDYDGYSDLYRIEPGWFREFNENLDTTDFTKEIEEALKWLSGGISCEATVTGLRLENSVEIVGDTLYIETVQSFNVVFSLNGSEISSTGKWCSAESEKKAFLKYTGELPPLGWPAEYIVENGYKETGIEDTSTDNTLYMHTIELDIAD